MPSRDQLCIHTITTKPWDLATAAGKYARAGVRGITVWRDVLAGRDLSESRTILDDSGLSVVSLCRGGFFPNREASRRQAAIDDNRRAIEEAHAIGTDLIVLVCGADPGQPLATSREQIADGIAALLPEAEAAGVRLGIEPLHPMYADTRSAINTLAQANVMAERFPSERVGVVVDVYHLWWDPALQSEIVRAGLNERLYAYHICDWRVPTEDLLLDRGLMGEGCIPLQSIRAWVEAAGFDGFHEVEIFSNRHWARDQDEFLSDILRAYDTHA